MRKRKIIAVTGARSDYDLLFSVYEKLNNDERFEFKIIITGPHLSDTFGYTAKYVEGDGFTIAGKIYSLVDANEKIGRINSIGYQIPSLANILNFEQPDIVLVAGDREEAITVTMTCAYLDIVAAHFFGGDIAKDGNIDNSVRYAASKFAHLHFPSLEAHRHTLLKLGEDDYRIYVMGNPAIDRLVATPNLSKDTVIAHAGGSGKNIDDYCVLIQHPIISEFEDQKNNIEVTLNAILEGTQSHCFINYPNSDAGFKSIIETYDTYVNRYPEKFTVFKNMDRLYYINLLRNANFLIGNSSSGIVEVASLGLPAINVGTRQLGRIHGNNVLFTGYDQSEVVKAIIKAESDREFIGEVKKGLNPYGSGNSTQFVVETLAEIEINDKLVHKNITY